MHIFHYRLLQYTEYSSLCYAVGLTVPDFLDEETEAQNDEVCPQSPSSTRLALYPGLPDSNGCALTHFANSYQSLSLLNTESQEDSRSSYINFR